MGIGVLVRMARRLTLQSYSNVEVLIIYDASTDSIRAIAEKFVLQDSRFKLFFAL